MNESLATVLLVFAAQVTAVATAGLLIGSLPRSAALRHNVLLAALLGVLVSPLLLVVARNTGLSLALPLLPAPRMTEVAPVASPPIVVSQQEQPLSPPEESLAPIAPVERPAARPTQRESTLGKTAVPPVVRYTPPPPRAEHLLLGLWGVGALVGLGGMLRAAWHTHRLLKSVRPLDASVHGDAVDEAGRQLGLRRFPRVGTTGRVAGPAVAGAFRSRCWILIPLRFLETLVRDELVQVLVHEGAHVVRRDPFIVLLQRIAGSLFWWHPLIHVLNRRLSRAREEICDNFVLQHVGPETYGATLSRLATLSPVARVSMGVELLDRGWKLEDRIRGLLDPRRTPTTRVRFTTAASVLAGFLLLPTLLCVTRVVAQSPQDPPLPPAVQQPEKPAAVENREPAAAVVKPIRLELTYEGESDKPFYNLNLQAKSTADPNKPFLLSESIGAEQSAKLVEHLTTAGFFKRSHKQSPKGDGPRYLFHVEQGDNHHYENLGWELGMLQDLDRMRKVLDGKPAEALDRLLGRLAGLRVTWLADLEQSKQAYRETKGESRLNAVKRIYPVIRVGTTRSEVLNYLGAPDDTKRGQLTRFFNYNVAEGQTIEVEFDPVTELVIRRREVGLGLDPPPAPAPAIPENLKAYLADYVAGKATLRAGFVPDKAELVWGEPLELTFHVENIGQQDFEFHFGGDYRGAGRHNRFQIEVVDEAGKRLPDPRGDEPHDFGGIVSREIVTPGGAVFKRTIDLTVYRTITKPGRYSITCSFALDDGPPAGAAKPVVKSSFPLTILARTLEHVARVLNELVGIAQTADEKQFDTVMSRIARFGKEDAVPHLAQFTAWGPLTRRAAALAALPLVTSDASEDVALAGLKDYEPVIRSAAARALGQFQKPRSLEALLNAFERESHPVNVAVLTALGSTHSPRALPVIATALEKGTPQLKAAGLDALVSFGGHEAQTELRKHVTSNDLIFRYKALRAWETSRQPMEAEWIVPILMSREQYHPQWNDTYRMMRLYCGDKAIPTLLSALDFDVPWSFRNYWILGGVEACSGAPKFEYEYDPNSEGTPEQWEKNRQTLLKLKPLAGPIPEAPPLPAKVPVPELKTDPQIDFKPVITPVPDDAERLKAVIIRSGFYQIRLNRNGSNYSYQPLPEHARPYNTAAVVKAMLKDPAKLAQSGLSAEKAERLRQVRALPDNVPYDGRVSPLYRNWREAPVGPLKDRATEELGDALRRVSQNYHLAVVAYAQTVEGILNDTAQAPPQLQQQRAEVSPTGVAEIHPRMQDSEIWRDLRERLAKAAVPYRRVEIDEQGHCRLNLGETPTTDVSHLKGAKLESLILSNTAVKDLSPLEGMSTLRVLDLSGSPVESLAPLKGIKLTRLNLTGTRVSDLSPLADAELKELVAIGAPIADLSPLASMPLTYLDLRRTRVTSLAPLAKLPLASLQIEDSPVADLTPVRGLPLKTLWLTGFKDQDLSALKGISATRLVLGGRDITDLTPLQGLPLESLSLDRTGVKDLAPLKGMPLTSIDIRESPVTDLSPLRGMKLTSLNVSEPGVDLAPLEGMPLESVGLPDVSTVKNLNVLRGIQTLKHIRPPDCKPLPSAEFWQQYDAR